VVNDFLVFASIYSALAVGIIIAFCLSNKLNNKTAEIFFGAALFRMIMTFGYYSYIKSTSSDAYTYYLYAINSNFIFSDFAKPGTSFINNFAVLFKTSISFFDNPCLMLFIPFSLLAFVGSLLFYKTIRSIGQLKHREAIILSFYLPNLLFWTSNIGKDSIIYLGLMMIIYGLVTPKIATKRIAYLIIGATIVYMVRPHVVLFLMVSFMGGFILERNKFSFRTVSILLIVLIGFLLTYQPIFKFAGISISAESETGENATNFYNQSLARIQSQQKNLAMGGAATKVNSIKYVFMPVYVVNFLCAPFFWQVRKPIHLLGAIESIIYQIMIIYIIRNIKLLIKDTHMPFKNTWIIYVLISSSIMGASFTNFGVTIRQRCMVIPFLILLYALIKSTKHSPGPIGMKNHSY
jgi:hypothetical protein